MAVNNVDPFTPSKEELIGNALQAVQTLGMGGANFTALTMAVLQARLSHENVQSIDALRETILQLDKTNGRLQKQMKWLTWVGLALAAISAVLGGIQVWEAWPR